MTNGLPRYRTGNDDTDALLLELVDQLGNDTDRDIVFELLVSVARLGTNGTDRGDLKLVNSALKELRYAFEVFGPYAERRKVSIFGSARTSRDSPQYAAARDFAAAMVAKEWMVITGAGPGIMTAGIEGAGASNSFGVNIQLPFESGATAAIADDPKLVNFKYFFTRKLTFMKESHGYALFPGGFGTLDEAFELLTLMQTGRTYLAPVVLLDAGASYWETWLHFIERELGDRGLISSADLDLVRITDDIGAAVDEICDFYRTYHSSRYVGRRLVLRLSDEPSGADVSALNREFADILESGSIDRIDATDSELADDDVVDLPRLALHFDRRSFGRLRHLVDRLNHHEQPS
ncbi:MAG: LOG family protein [Acidimicrobiia bacterium]|nr:LOG family protein [Acidimicrobiia bacterium]